MDVYELTGAEPTRTRLQAAAARMLTRFVGRQQEIETLRQALERASTGHGQVVAVIGEPGMGKSRLFYEFTQVPHMQGWLIIEAGAVSSYGKATPYLPIIELLKAYFQVECPDDGRGMREGVVDKLVALDEALRPTLPALFTLLDMPVEDPPWQALEPPQRRQRILDAVKRLLLRESQVQPLLVIVENLHWIDTETQAVLDSMVESLPSARLLLLVNYRTDYQHSWGNKTYYTQLRLDPLPPARAEELLQALLGRDASLQPLTQCLIERTEGNPFFLEESVWTLAETKALVGERGAYRVAQALPSIQVPATVHAMLAARIDRLPTEDKRLLQAAAVIGRHIPFPLLQAIAEEPEETLRRSLAHLQVSEFLYELQLFPDHVYTFKHALTQEVAYQSLLQRTRQHYHRHIAQVMTEQFPDTVATRPELLARHYTEAGLSAQAIPYWERAGQRAVERSADIEAINHLTKGLEVLKTLPDTLERSQQELTLHLALGAAILRIKGYEDPELEQAYSRAQQLCQQVGDSSQRFSALVGLWRYYLSQTRFQTARELAEQCFTLAQDLDDSVLLQEAHVILGTTLVYLGELVSARAHLEQGIALHHLQQGRSLAFNREIDPGVACLSQMSWVLWLLGYADQALTRSREACTLAQQLSRPYSLAYALAMTSGLFMFRREAQHLQEQVETMIALAQEQGFARWLAVGRGWRGWALAERGEVQEGLAQLRQAPAMKLSQQPLRLAEVYGKAGQAEEGLRVLTDALAAVSKNEERRFEAELHRVKGELLLMRSTGTGCSRAALLEVEAETCFCRAIDVAHAQHAKSFELRGVMSLSRLWQQQGRRNEARDMLANVYNWFTEGFDTPDLQEAKALLEVLQ